MTLYRQLSIIIIFIFLAMFTGTFAITLDNSRQYLNSQLQSHAQDTATMLGLSISPYLKDKAVLDTMVNAVFDRGDYRLIRIENLAGKAISERTVRVVIENVPNWFIRFIPLITPVGDSLVMSGWNKMGTVYVESHPGYAYQEAWRNVTDTFFWFLACAVLIFSLGLMLLRQVMKPLHAVEIQAEAICRKEFIIQKEIPKTRELQRVVTVMNKLSIKVEEMFLEQAELAEGLRKQLFSSSVTGLGNRRYFDLQLKHLIDSPEELDSGVLFLIALQNLDQINREYGYQAGDKVLQKTAAILQKQSELAGSSLLAHFSGSEFVLFLPVMPEDEVDQLADRICRSLVELQSLGISEVQASGHVGVAVFQAGQSSSELFSCADLALRNAQAQGVGAWHRNPNEVFGNQITIYGAQEWRQRLQKAVKSNRINLFFQPVTTIDGAIMHHEVLARIPDYQGRLIPAGVFMPMAERENLAVELDKIIVTTLLEFMARQKNRSDCFAINLSPRSVQNSDFVNWLADRLKSHSKFAARLFVEMAEHGVFCQVETIRSFVDRIAPLNCRFAIDHFGKGFTSFSYLRKLKVSYLKIDGGFIRHIANNEENQFFVQALSKTAHELEIPVIAEYVEEQEDKDALLMLSIDGLQGFLIGEPAEPI